MENSSTLRLLASANNQRGDLFTRLVSDLFFALGYGDLPYDVHKSGRELDIQGQHRLEARRLVAECKAHAEPMGGAELNKFYGALTRERRKSGPTPVASYFVSLSGFTETGIEQEDETGDDRLILLDAPKIIAGLVESRVLVSPAAAAEQAGRCAARAGLQGAAFDGAELLGHSRGYLWAIFYAQGKARTHFTLIHADGTALAEVVAREVIEADRAVGGSLHALRYLAPPSPPPDRAALARQAMEHYRKWLDAECGFIQLDGLPADTNVSSKQLRLEHLFVPLKASFLPEADEQLGAPTTREEAILPVGEMLGKTPHLALLAAPGGGKSTLLKWLATAYAFPERRAQVADGLPDRFWQPFFLRCRELRDKVREPIQSLLDALATHMALSPGEAEAFREAMHEAIRAGDALLLIDGLDEISREGDRAAFAAHLRTFLAMFPQVTLVVTSREAGFRNVAGVVASACRCAKLAPLDEADVLRLCERWYVEVIADTPKVRADAQALAWAIWQTERIQVLARNPLLLTTLLVVKRWLRELPRNRAALYWAAASVLIRTWNTEGYEPLEEEETFAQLSYVACAMMADGRKTQVGRKALLRLLQDARRELEAELRFVRISPQEFLERVEYRSSLLMQTGEATIDDEWQPVFEFRHLTFQEYLAARGLVEEHYPGRGEDKSLADLLEPHFRDEEWVEVVPLALVLAKRNAEETIRRLTAACGAVPAAQLEQLKRDRILERPIMLLRQCLLDGVTLADAPLRRALQQLARDHRDDEDFGDLVRSKLAPLFREVAEQSYLRGDSGWEEYGGAVVSAAVYARFGSFEGAMAAELAASLLAELSAGTRVDKLRAALVCMRLAFSAGEAASDPETHRGLQPLFQMLRNALIPMVNEHDLPLALAACWPLAWTGRRRLLTVPPPPELVLSAFRLWREPASEEMAYFSSWALGSQPLLVRDTFDAHLWGACDDFLAQEMAQNDWVRREAALVVAWYRRAPWIDAELAEKVRDLTPGFTSNEKPTPRELLENLGEPGKRALAEWREMFPPGQPPA